MKQTSRILSLVLVMLLVGTQAFSAVTYSKTIISGPYAAGGNSMQTVAEINLAGTYATSGFTLTPGDFGLSHIKSAIIQGEDGYLFWYNPTTGKVFVFQSAAVTPAGTVTQPTFTGTNATISPTAGLATNPVFTGTNATIAPTATLEVTDTTTSGMYAVYYSASAHTFGYFNTGAGTKTDATIDVTGASYTPAGTNDKPAITVIGASYTPAGTVSQPTFSGTATTAAALAEVGAGTSLAAVDKVTVIVEGF